MIEIPGKFNTARVMTDYVEAAAFSQIMELCNQPWAQDVQIRVMPDVHAGKGCVIGFTMPVVGKVVPNLVGVDIGCGMLVCQLPQAIDVIALDKFIRENIPAGHEINTGSNKYCRDIVSQITCLRDLKGDAAQFARAEGSLGGGNHFIEVDVDDDGNYYLVIHSGSRNVGKQVAEFHQRKAVDYQNGLNDKYQADVEEIIRSLKAEGKKDQIPEALKKLKAERYHGMSAIPRDLCYLEGMMMKYYLHDMQLCQNFALLNRNAMMKKILAFLGQDFVQVFQTIHNYISVGDPPMLRKGAVDAGLGQTLIIPLDMQHGALICKGKGNKEWNESAPHGAGRIMSRSEAKKSVSLEEFQKSMEGIYTTSVSVGTLDEAPQVYKKPEDIEKHIGDTVEIVKKIRPIHNFKAGGEKKDD